MLWRSSKSLTCCKSSFAGRGKVSDRRRCREANRICGDDQSKYRSQKLDDNVAKTDVLDEREEDGRR